MELSFNKENYEIELSKVDDFYSVVFDKATQDFNLRSITDNTFQIQSEARNYMAYSAEDKSHIYVNVDGESFVFDKIDSSKSFEIDDANKGNIDIIKSSMPGNVVKVLVAKDQKVSEGDGLIILEAMKMETTLFSSISGIVKELNVNQGEQVDSDKILIVIEKEEVI